ncbi:autotransporter outer membrane beta-barrel domain-containing protein [Pantoea sp. 18069]|uniref:autotransporter family protein n=1 Tax=Pantoea sp. 18069 TaxID=2681415 RepID=UPI001356D78B|nr:autotransporter outer membrane beta-barrel domain-containing protein [Pantoea sp. 18069]
MNNFHSFEFKKSSLMVVVYLSLLSISCSAEASEEENNIHPGIEKTHENYFLNLRKNKKYAFSSRAKNGSGFSEEQTYKVNIELLSYTPLPKRVVAVVAPTNPEDRADISAPPKPVVTPSAVDPSRRMEIYPAQLQQGELEIKEKSEITSLRTVAVENEPEEFEVNIFDTDFAKRFNQFAQLNEDNESVASILYFVENTSTPILQVNPQSQQAAAAVQAQNNSVQLDPAQRVVAEPGETPPAEPLQVIVTAVAPVIVKAQLVAPVSLEIPLIAPPRVEDQSGLPTNAAIQPAPVRLAPRRPVAPQPALGNRPTAAQLHAVQLNPAQPVAPQPALGNRPTAAQLHAVQLNPAQPVAPQPALGNRPTAAQLHAVQLHPVQPVAPQPALGNRPTVAQLHAVQLHPVQPVAPQPALGNRPTVAQLHAVQLNPAQPVAPQPALGNRPTAGQLHAVQLNPAQPVAPQPALGNRPTAAQLHAVQLNPAQPVAPQPALGNRPTAAQLHAAQLNPAQPVAPQPALGNRPTAAQLHAAQLNPAQPVAPQPALGNRPTAAQLHAVQLHPAQPVAPQPAPGNRPTAAQLNAVQLNPVPTVAQPPMVDRPTVAQLNSVQLNPVQPVVTSSIASEQSEQVAGQPPAVPEAIADAALMAPAPVAPAGGVGADENPLSQIGQSAGLQSSYRAEMPLVSALPAQLRQGDLAMLGDLHKRLGDEASGAGHDRRAWGRVLRADTRIRQHGTVSPQSEGHLDGFQVGHDLYADQGVKAGLYVGQLEGNMGVHGLANGVARKSVGFNRLQSRYLGAYGTWQDAAGSYADSVVQWADYRSQLHAADDSHATTKGDGWLASLEVGKTLALNSQWQIEPQAQIIYRQISLDDTALNLAHVKHKAPSDWTLRLGMRIKASLTTHAGVFQPYGRINVYKASRTTDVASFITPVAETDILAQGGYTSTELAAGATLQLNERTSLYGELGQRWANAGDARVKSAVQASVAVKLHW